MTEASDEARREKVVRRIASLMDKANASEFPDEADTFREHAQNLMREWQVEEWQLDEARAARGESRSMKVGTIVLADRTPWRESFIIMAYRIAEAMDLKAIIIRNEDDKAFPFSGRDPEWAVEIFGFQVDLSYMQMLFTSLQLDCASNVDYKPKPELGFDLNVFNLHESGNQWEASRRALNLTHRQMCQKCKLAGAVGPNTVGADLSCGTDHGAPWPLLPGHPVKTDGGRMLRAYRRECERQDKPYHKNVNQTEYKATFVRAYTTRIIERVLVNRMRSFREAGTELVLKSRSDAILEVYKEKYRETRELKMKQTQGQLNANAYARGRELGDKAKLERDAGIREEASSKAFGRIE